MVVKSSVLLLLALIISGCGITRDNRVAKIALVAPFEGQYREIGYEALYAAQLALTEMPDSRYTLVPIDDGGSVDTAALRLAAISEDPAMAAVLLLGSYATTRAAQQHLEKVPAVIVGHWQAAPFGEDTIMLAHPRLGEQAIFAGDITDLTALDEAISGSEILSLEQVPQWVDAVELIDVYSSGSLPDPDFRERYLASAEFVPEPRLIAPLTYDAIQIVLTALQGNITLAEVRYDGLNGTFQFAEGYWQNAPINHFIYQDRQLVVAP